MAVSKGFQGHDNSAAGAISPLAPKQFPNLPTIKGLYFASAAAGIKYQDRDDVMLAIAPPASTIAGVFTRSATRSANVLDCQAKLAQPINSDAPLAILVNSGNSNAFTGQHGDNSVQALSQAVADRLNCHAAQVFTASTGVIGELLPHDRIIAVLDQLVENQSPDGAARAARAIMTTDTFAKAAATTVMLGDQPVQIFGIAKGSGMIAPDMATMLVYLFTDAAVEQGCLQSILDDLVGPTFNAITVDGDCSTSDTLMLLATGTSDAAPINSRLDAHCDAFAGALHNVMLDLAHQVVRDGEGASKFIEVAISGAKDDHDARKVAFAIANSPLVKTAIAGEDPNWGRVVMAVGKSGASADRDRLSIRFGDILVAENGWVAPSYREADAAAYMKGAEILIDVDLGIGAGQAQVWTCDLTHDYISINADYRS